VSVVRKSEQSDAKSNNFVSEIISINKI